MTTPAWVQQTQLEEQKLGLRNDYCRSQFLLQPKATGKVCLFFHGFTAAPYQFVPIGQTLYAAGYNVLIPRLPGHGQAGNWSKDNLPPLPTDPNIYKKYALIWLDRAAALGSEVVVGGLSGGASLAAWLSIEKASVVDRALLYAAYLGNSRFVIDIMVNSFKSYLEWKGVPKDRIPGYSGFQMPALKACLDIGQEALRRSATQACPPMFILSTEADIAVNNHDHRTLFNNIVKRQPLSWYYQFDKSLNIPHPMLLAAEGNAWQNVLTIMSKAYVQSRLSWAEVEEIAYRMTEGKTYPQVIKELGLTAKTSPDMPAMITMIDKRALIERRNPSNVTD